MVLYDYFDRIAAIHLPDRKDRNDLLARELRTIGADIRQPRVEIPFAPMPEDANGFSSRGVYGNILSHCVSKTGVAAEPLVLVGRTL